MKAPEPLVWAVRRMAIDYRKPARVDDALDVRTRVEALGGARMQLKQSIARGADLLVSAEVEVCVLTLDGRPRRVPEVIRGQLQGFLET